MKKLIEQLLAEQRSLPDVATVVRHQHSLVAGHLCKIICAPDQTPMFRKRLAQAVMLGSGNRSLPADSGFITPPWVDFQSLIPKDKDQVDAVYKAVSDHIVNEERMWIRMMQVAVEYNVDLGFSALALSRDLRSDLCEGLNQLGAQVGYRQSGNYPPTIYCVVGSDLVPAVEALPGFRKATAMPEYELGTVRINGIRLTFSSDAYREEQYRVLHPEALAIISEPLNHGSYSETEFKTWDTDTGDQKVLQRKIALAITNLRTVVGTPVILRKE